jgi:beta-lactamase regulating signal transducer with metallopeptidase domain
MSLSPYLMNVALHAAMLPGLAAAVLLFLRKPAQRAFAALAGLIGAGIFSWGTPLLIDADQDPREERVLPAAASIRVWKVAAPPAGDAESSQVPAPSSAPAYSVPPLRVLGAWAWLAGSLLSLGAVVIAGFRLSGWRRGHTRPDFAERAMLEPVLPRGLSVASVMITDSAVSPCVAGLFRPVVVVPRAMLATVTPEELRWTLQHEHRHLRGMDSRWTVCLAMLRAVFWWNPFIHYLAIKWSEAREQVCDLDAAGTGNRAAYGELLIRMAAAKPAGCLLASPMVRTGKRVLRKRILSLLSAAPAEKNAVGPLFGVGTAVILLGTALFSSGFGVAEKGNGGAVVFGMASAKDPAAPEAPVAALPTLQVKLVSAVVFTPRAIAENQKVLSRETWEALRATFAADSGNPAKEFPAISCRNGEKALIEIVHENPESSETKPKAGWQIGLHPVCDGKELVLAAEFHYGFVPGAHYSPTSKAQLVEEDKERKKPLDWSRLVVREGRAKASLAEGSVLATALGEVTPGWYATVFTQADPIDRTGRPVSRFEDAIYEPEPPKEEVPGKVRLEGLFLKDLQSFQTPQEVDEMAIGLGAIFTAEQWKTVKDGLEGKPLGAVTLEYGKESEPWKELPGVKLTVRRYKGEPLVEVEFSMPLDVPVKVPGKVPGRYGIAYDPDMVIVTQLTASSEGKRPGLAIMLEEVK